LGTIRDITALIRSAIYGKDVRESIAVGIEQISDKEDAFELRVINNNDVFQQGIITRESTFETNITNKETAFENSINNSEITRVNNEITRVAAETSRANTETARVGAETSRVTAEASRVSAETTRAQSEALRVSEWATWKNQNTMMQDLYVRKAVLIPTKTALTVTRAALAINPLNSYSVASVTTVANNTIVDNGMTKDNLCYYGRNQVRGSDSILFKTFNEYTLNGAEVI
jgi:hypothetical protein